MEPTSEEKIVAGLVHLAILLDLFGVIASIVVYVLYRPKSAFVTRHTKQSLALQIISLVLAWVVPLALGVSTIGFFSIGSYITFAPRVTAAIAGTVLVGFVQIALLVMAIIAAVRAFQGQEYLHPLFGQWVDRLGQ